jgi:hypothetical protein
MRLDDSGLRVLPPILRNTRFAATSAAARFSATSGVSSAIHAAAALSSRLARGVKTSAVIGGECAP